MINRDEGCNKVDCLLCGYRFCWRCGSGWSQQKCGFYQCGEEEPVLLQSETTTTPSIASAVATPTSETMKAPKEEEPSKVSNLEERNEILHKLCIFIYLFVVVGWTGCAWHACDWRTTTGFFLQLEPIYLFILPVFTQLSHTKKSSIPHYTHTHKQTSHPVQINTTLLLLNMKKNMTWLFICICDHNEYILNGIQEGGGCLQKGRFVLLFMWGI